MKRLLEIQQTLNAPKDKFNSFGNYSYRSCEGILEAVKPLLKKHGLVLTIKDEIVDSCGKNYIMATVSLFDAEDSKCIESVSAFAREAESKKGMDDSQVTGATSSYARKYALNGLFLIDDNKDSDTDEFTKASQDLTRTATEIGDSLPVYNPKGAVTKPEKDKIEAKTKVTL